jgi:hypothetical protein
MAQYGGMPALSREKTPFPTRQMAILGELHGELQIRILG